MKLLEVEFIVSNDPRIAKEAIMGRLEVLPLVEEASLRIDETRQGFGDAITVLVGTVMVLQLGTAAVSQLRQLLRELAGLQRDLTGVQSILVKVENEKLDPSKIDDNQLQKILDVANKYQI
jgi:hypothetical protein